MKRRAIVVIVVFAFGVAVGVLARGKAIVEPVMYRGQPNDAVVRALLDASLAPLDDGAATAAEGYEGVFSAGIELPRRHFFEERR